VTVSLEALAERISICTLCPLSKSRTMAVPGEGRRDAEVMFVGEGPGVDEDRLGRPFVGAAGRHLDTLLSKIGLKREEVYITNVVKCRPPGNRVPTWDEREACRPYLEEQIMLIKPVLICPLGNTALETLTGRFSISRFHGKLFEKDERLFFPMYHPAAALHNPDLKHTLERDMLELKRTLDELKIRGYEASKSDAKLEDFLF